MEVDVLPQVCYHYNCKKNRKGKSANVDAFALFH